LKRDQKANAALDAVVSELVELERRCARGVAPLQAEAPRAVIRKVIEICDEFQKSWSGSWIGYQSRIYYGEFEPIPPGATYSVEWGSREGRLSNPTAGDWREYSYEAIADEIIARSGNPDLQQLEALGNSVTETFELVREELFAVIDAICAEKADQTLLELRSKVSGIQAFHSVQEMARGQRPREIRSRDSTAMGQGLQVPAHIAIRARLESLFSREAALIDLASSSRQARLYLEKRMKLQGLRSTHRDGKVFIGHGKSPIWRDLKDLLQDRMALDVDEFNLQSAAGLTTKERLEEMLDSASFAFLIMTAEDQHADGTRHARENVIHEVGLFQGKLGFTRAIVLLEDGCAAFSNIQGVTQIRFPQGDIRAKSEEIRAVLEREEILLK